MVKSTSRADGHGLGTVARLQGLASHNSKGELRAPSWTMVKTNGHEVKAWSSWWLLICKASPEFMVVVVGCARGTWTSSPGFKLLVSQSSRSKPAAS
ncbi:hypothetical protein H5410_050725 [Solanum commersonii]|uniref:Uncharacterized protein n=1 Tax=Solanum commersonii TaxID=4109 RepID=A0A9J5WWD2_SOLCO|nr:hypothetical protein H5410_050725 [Solanum commersonii]